MIMWCDPLRLGTAQWIMERGRTDAERRCVRLQYRAGRLGRSWREKEFETEFTAVVQDEMERRGLCGAAQWFGVGRGGGRNVWDIQGGRVGDVERREFDVFLSVPDGGSVEGVRGWVLAPPAHWEVYEFGMGRGPEGMRLLRGRFEKWRKLYTEEGVLGSGFGAAVARGSGMREFPVVVDSEVEGESSNECGTMADTLMTDGARTWRRFEIERIIVETLTEMLPRR